MQELVAGHHFYLTINFDLMSGGGHPDALASWKFCIACDVGIFIWSFWWFWVVVYVFLNLELHC